MHADLADLAIAAPDDDLMDGRGDQFADDRVASGIVRRDGDRLATSSRCQVSPGCGRRRRSLLAKSAPNFRHQCRMLSWVTTMPRSARISSTSRRLKLKTWYSHTEWLMISAGNRWRGYEVDP